MPAPRFRFRRHSLTNYHNLQLAHAGVPSAIEAVVDRLRPRLTKMAWYYARRTRADADDLLQEAWVALLEALGELDVTIGDPEQYLILRARWRMLDSIKHAQARCRNTTGDAVHDEWNDEAAAESTVTHDMEHALAALCTAEFVAHLKPTQRAIVRCLLRGFTWREAGSTLGCTSANIAYHVRQIGKAYERWDADQLRAI